LQLTAGRERCAQASRAGRRPAAAEPRHQGDATRAL